LRVTRGDEVVERELTVLKDPSSVGSQEDIEAQLALLLDIRAATDSTVSLINHIELVREQLDAMAVRLEGRPEVEDLLAAADTLDQELIDLEMMLFDLRLSGGLSRQEIRERNRSSPHRPAPGGVRAIPGPAGRLLVDREAPGDGGPRRPERGVAGSGGGPPGAEIDQRGSRSALNQVGACKL
jgi:hypothetical protein